MAGVWSEAEVKKLNNLKLHMGKCSVKSCPKPFMVSICRLRLFFAPNTVIASQKE